MFNLISRIFTSLSLLCLISTSWSSVDRFERADSGVITDRETTLQWLEGPDRAMSWIQSKEWIDRLGSDWRLPSQEELKKIFLKDSTRTGKYGDDLKIDGSFEREAAYNLWAEATKDGYATQYDFSRGRGKHAGQNIAGHFDRAVAVRGEDPTIVIPGDGRFIRNEESGIIEDLKTGLQWLEGPEKPTSWEGAQEWLATLNDGWRAPTVEELKSLYLEESKRKGVHGDPLHIHRSFHMEKAYSLWSVGRTSNSAWMYDFSRGYAHWTEAWVVGTYDRAIAVRSKAAGAEERARTIQFFRHNAGNVNSEREGQLHLRGSVLQPEGVLEWDPEEFADYALKWLNYNDHPADNVRGCKSFMGKEMICYVKLSNDDWIYTGVFKLDDEEGIENVDLHF